MRRGLVGGIVAIGFLLAPHAEAKSLVPHGHPIAALNANQSNNWGGYNQGILEAGKSGGFTQASASWVVPTATQHTSNTAESSSMWVGIGGGCLDTACTATDNTLIQAGSESDVDASGNATYGVWWEIIPGPSVSINLPVTAGDTVSVDLRETLPTVWTITLKVNGATFTQMVPYSSTHATVEWIEETPLLIGTNAGLAALPNLTKGTFSASKVNNANPNLTAAEEVDLIDANGKVIVKPSSPTGGNTFSVCAWATSCT